MQHVGWDGHRNLYQVSKKQRGAETPMERTESDPTSTPSAGFLGREGHRSSRSRPLRTQRGDFKGRAPARPALTHGKPSMLNFMPEHENYAVLIERTKLTPSHTRY